MTRTATTPSPRRARTTTPRSESPPERLWRAAWVLPVTAPPVRDGAVLVRDGAIAAVGPAAELTAAAPRATVRDLGSCILCPGLVDAHCHLEWSLLDGLLPPAEFSRWLGRLLPLRPRLTPDDHRTAARFGALRALEAGTTTVSDSGPTGAGAQALAESGLRGLVHLEAFGREAGDAADAAADVLLARAAELDAQIGPRGRVGISPHAPYTVGPDYWRALLARAGDRERPWATHLAESAAEERVIASGDGPLGDLFAAGGLEPGRWPGPAQAGPVARAELAGVLRPGLVAAHCVRLGPGDPRRLAGAGVAVAHCPRSNLHLRCGRAPLEELRDAGVAVGLGTDSPASGGDYDLRAEARACRRAHAEVHPLDDGALLRLITADAARAVGMEATVGSLAPGLRADLLAVAPAGDRTAPEGLLMDPRSTVEMVVIDGDVAVERGVATGLDGERLRARAAEVRQRLC